MAIQYVGGVKGGRAGSTSTGSQSLSGTLTGGLASSPATGDLVIILIGVASASGYAPTTLAVSGWTNGTFRSNTGVTNYSYQQYSYKFMGGTPDTSITIPSSGNARNAQSWAVHVFRNVDSITPLDATTVFASGTASGRPNPGSITPVTAGAWILWAGASAAGTGATYTAPTDFSTNWLTQTNVDTYDSMVGFGYYTGWTSGAYDPAAITAGGTTGSTDSWVAETLVLRPAKMFTGSGGMTAAGTATTTWHRQFAATGSGGITAAGSATTLWEREFVFTASGGMTAAGAATTGQATSKEYTASGGMTLAGDAVTVGPALDHYAQYYWGVHYWGARYWGGQYWSLGFSPTAYSYTATGGMIISGTVEYAKGHVFPVSGGMTTDGSATLVKGKTPTGTGGMTAAGAATTTWHRQFAFTASGGMTAAGAATLVKGKIYTPTGGATAAGAAVPAKGKIYTGSGSTLTGGAATVARTFAYAMVASGALLTGGAAIVAHTVVKTYTGSGGMTIAGAADTSISIGTSHYPYVGSGGITSGGSATLARTVAWAYTATGGAIVAGSADTSSGGLNTWVGSGGITSGGSAETSHAVARSFLSTGGIFLDGSADTLYHSSIYEYVGEGGRELVGSATSFYLSIQDLRATDNSGIRRFVYSFTTPFAS